jgi:hypothetical protein
MIEALCLTIPSRRTPLAPLDFGVRPRGTVWKTMRTTRFLALVLVLALVEARAQAANPMDALQFYVGTWSCVERPAHSPPLSSTFTFAMEANLMREWIDQRRTQGSMRAPAGVNATFAYDSKHHRYVETEMYSDGSWYVSVANPWKGNTIQWVDVASWTNLSRWEMTRVNATGFTLASFAKVTDKTPNYTATCKRAQQDRPRTGT